MAKIKRLIVPIYIYTYNVCACLNQMPQIYAYYTIYIIANLLQLMKYILLYQPIIIVV